VLLHEFHNKQKKDDRNLKNGTPSFYLAAIFCRRKGERSQEKRSWTEFIEGKFATTYMSRRQEGQLFKTEIRG